MSRLNNIIDNCELISAGEAKLLSSLVLSYRTASINGEETESDRPSWAEFVWFQEQQRLVQQQQQQNLEWNCANI